MKLSRSPALLVLTALVGCKRKPAESGAVARQLRAGNMTSWACFRP